MKQLFYSSSSLPIHNDCPLLIIIFLQARALLFYKLFIHTVRPSGLPSDVFSTCIVFFINTFSTDNTQFSSTNYLCLTTFSLFTPESVPPYIYTTSPSSFLFFQFPLQPTKPLLLTKYFPSTFTYNELQVHSVTN